MAKKTSIGGQAVIEGIMMKGPKKTALAVRIPDGTVDIEYIEEKHLRDKCKIFGWPVIRGSVNFIESMITGYGAMSKSIDKSGFADIEEDDKKATDTPEQETPAADEAVTDADMDSAEDANDGKVEEEKPKEKEQSRFMTVLMIVASVLGVALSIVLFMWLPARVFDFVDNATGNSITSFKAAFEGVLKMFIFFIYILLVSRMKDIRRVFMYHGAEHKTIFCYEEGLPLTVENARKMSRFHPRCGTSFMILMLVVGIVLGMVVTWMFPVLRDSSFRWAWVIIKILKLPVICGFGYELLKICGRHDNLVTRAIAKPGMWMQRLTTVEPEDDMLELAIKSIEAVLPENEEDDNW